MQAKRWTRRELSTFLLGAASVSAAPQEDRMFAVPGLPEDPAAIDWSRVPVLKGETIRVFAGTAGESAYNNHAYLEHFDGRFWAIWSCHATQGNYHGMHVRYATSSDGRQWSEAKLLSQIPKGERYVARGLWVRNGELLALASLDSGQPGAQKHWGAADLRLMGFAWRGGQWQDLGVIYDDTLNNFPPKRLPNGLWAMARRDYQFNLSLMFGGVKAYNHWEIREVPNREGRSFNEPDFIVRADGTVAMHIRDGGNSRRLYRSVSADGGNTWTNPVRTNFPDANSKNFNLKLSNGVYVLISNANAKGRVPLTLAASRDGIVFTRIGVVEGSAGKPRIPGHDKGPGYTYPHAIEHGGSLYLVFAWHRDDIVIRRYDIAMLALEFPG
jgi:hypothetical protein